MIFCKLYLEAKTKRRNLIYVIDVFKVASFKKTWRWYYRPQGTGNLPQKKKQVLQPTKEISHKWCHNTAMAYSIKVRCFSTVVAQDTSKRCHSAIWFVEQRQHMLAPIQ